jgi:hypothetical protein
MGQYQDALQSFLQVMENVPDHQVCDQPVYYDKRVCQEGEAVMLVTVKDYLTEPFSCWHCFNEW